jgi:hypothetical protein
MYERRHEPLAPQSVFIRRVVRNAAIALAVVAVSLAIGAAGYRVFVGLPWLDATLNAAMILGGMGPVDRIESAGGKVFATVYALYSGIAFLTVVAVLLAPVYHRFIHRFHLDESGKRP